MPKITLKQPTLKEDLVSPKPPAMTQNTNIPQQPNLEKIKEYHAYEPAD
jgi:hypothetical protein